MHFHPIQGVQLNEDLNGLVNDASCIIFQAIQFEGQRGRPTLCLPLTEAIELALVVPDGWRRSSAGR